MYVVFVICIVDLKISVELVFYVCCDMYRLQIKLYFIYLLDSIWKRNIPIVEDTCTLDSETLKDVNRLFY